MKLTFDYHGGDILQEIIFDLDLKEMKYCGEYLTIEFNGMSYVVKNYGLTDDKKKKFIEIGKKFK